MMPTSDKSKSKTKRKASAASSASRAVRRNSSDVGVAPPSAPCPHTESLAKTLIPCRLITGAELGQIVPYTGQHIMRLEKAGKFPRRIKVGPNRIAWLLSEVEAWVAARVAERDGSIR